MTTTCPDDPVILTAVAMLLAHEDTKKAAVNDA